VYSGVVSEPSPELKGIKTATHTHGSRSRGVRT